MDERVTDNRGFTVIVKNFLNVLKIMKLTWQGILQD